VHEANEPNAVLDLLDADLLAGEDVAQIDLGPLKQIRPQCVTMTLQSWQGYSSSSSPL
jgi:hypothetical protein